MTAYSSRYKTGAKVDVDPWSVNPLLQDAEQSQPDLVKLARLQNGEPPTLFVTGDTPPFTASGIDPSLLRLLPYAMRHAAAQEPDRLTVLGMIEQNGHNPDASVDSEGLSDYEARISDWLAGKWTNPTYSGQPDQTAVTTANDDLYTAMFGDQEKAQAERLAAMYPGRGQAGTPATP